MEGCEMRTKGIFLTLLTMILALTFPGMSVCATEQQTDKTDSGGATLDQKAIDYFNANGIYYYDPNEETDAEDSDKLIAEMTEEILTQRQEISDMERLVQAEKAQILAMQEQVTYMGFMLLGLTVMLICVIAYSIRMWFVYRNRAGGTTRSDTDAMKIINFHQHP